MRVGGCGATVEVLGYTVSTPQWSSTATQHCEHPWPERLVLRWLARKSYLNVLFCLLMPLLVLIATLN